MSVTKTAYFVRKPRVLEDLQNPHANGTESPYEIVKRIPLGKISYENFYTDMVADRQFLEDFAPICTNENVRKCLLVHQRGRKDGILVVPDGCYVGSAAYISEIEREDL